MSLVTIQLPYTVLADATDAMGIASAKMTVAARKNPDDTFIQDRAKDYALAYAHLFNALTHSTKDGE